MPKTAPMRNIHGSVPSHESSHRPPSMPNPKATTKVQPIFMYGPIDRIICGHEGLEGGGFAFPDIRCLILSMLDLRKPLFVEATLKVILKKAPLPQNC